MRVRRGISAAVAVLTILGTSATAATALVAASSPAVAATTQAATATHAVTWKGEFRSGNVRLRGQLPLQVSQHSKVVTFLHKAPASAKVALNFGLPLRDKAGLNALIAKQGKNHTQMSRAEIYQKFSPSAAQYSAVRTWLMKQGYKITHVGRDRTAITASASVGVVQRSLKTQINDYARSAYTWQGIKIARYGFYSNTKAPSVPARLGLQSITGLNSIDRFFTDIQLTNGLAKATGTKIGSATANAKRSPNTRSGGYYPRDVRAMYDVQGNATGQTVGFTLWGAGETQKAMTDFGTAVGDQATHPITVDTACVANGTPYQPSSCTTQQEAPDHLVTILENGNLNGAAPDSGNFQYGGNDETALDIEQAHGVAQGAGMKYYDADCSATPSPGLSNAGCNGSDVGLEEAVEDSSDDPTLHTVSDSWGIGGDAEYSLQDPFYLQNENAMAIGAAAGTTVWVGVGDSGTEFAGWPADSDYALGVGGTGIFSTTALTSSTPGSASLSTELTWDDGGSWCAATEPRPSWQDGPGVTANAPCPGRINPDVSAIADSASTVFEEYSTSLTTDRSGSVAGTSVAGPELNGMEAVQENFVAAQTYNGPTPTVGFEGPVMYQLGNGPNASSIYRDVLCGNTADPIGGPDGDAALPGWDAATGFGAPDSNNYDIGYAQALGATGLTLPPSINQNYAYTCARTPGNASERSISLPTNSVGYSLGAASGSTPWPAMFMPSGAWGAVNTFYKTTDGGATWQTTNSDMLSIACPTTTTCVEVGDGGRIRRSTDSGTTWTYVNSPFDKALTQIACPSATICYTAGARGSVMKSTDGGLTWSFLQSADDNPIYGMACPSTTVCYMTDLYAHIMKTVDGGNTFSMEVTPVTTPAINVPGSGGPNPFAGLFGITCTDINDCVAVGGFPPTGTDSPIVTTTNGGNSWTLQTSNSGANDYLSGVSCAGGTCYAVGRGGAIVTSTNPTAVPATWTKMTSNVTTMLNDITCQVEQSGNVCIATGQTGTVDVLNGGVWTPTTALGSSNFLSSVACVNATHCYTAGKQGVTLAFDWTNVAGSVVQQAGGGTTQQMNSISCVDAGDCVAVGNAGTILTTTNAGQTWLPSTSGTAVNLSGVSCNGSVCEAAGAATAGAAVILGSTNSGVTWTPQTSGTANALTAISCPNASSCVAVGAAGTILTTSTGGATWAAAPALSPAVTAALSAVTCPTSTNCYIAGAVVSGNAVLLASTTGGSSWTAQVSHAPQALTNIACTNATSCFAGGAGGTIVSTVDGGNNWAQQGDPLSGPTTALNATVSSIDAINGAACSSLRCAFGTGADGNMMTTPLVTITVNTSSAFGNAPNLSNLSPSNSAISVSPAGQANNLSGSLTCSTTANSSSDAGVYPVNECSGLSDSGNSVVYDLADSNHTVGTTSQSITFDLSALPQVTFGDPGFNAGAFASSGLPVSYSVPSPADDNICSVDSNGNVSILGAGTCSITASQGGNNDYNPATSVTQSFTIDQASQSISISTPPAQEPNFGDADFEVDASATSGLPVTLTAGGSCTVTPDTSPAQVHITGAGTCTITGSQAGNDNYLPADDVTDMFNTGQDNQTISFGALPDATFGDSPVSLNATATSGLTVSFGAVGECSVSGTTLTLTGAGPCAVTASQAGDDDYNAAPGVVQDFTIAKEAQTISFASLPSVQFGSGNVTVHATAGSGDDVTFAVSGDCTIHDNTTVKLIQVGSCTVTASQPGDSNFTAAPNVSQSFTITKGDQSISFASLADKTLGASDFSVSATATSGDAVTFTAGNGSNCTVSGDTVHLTGTGTCSVVAAQGGDSNYNAASNVTRTFTITKATPTVSVMTTPSAPTTGPVTYTVSVLGVTGFVPTGAVTVSDGAKSCSTGSLSNDGTGSCSILETAGAHSITASYAGDSNFTTATGTLSETVKKATPTVTFTTKAPASPHGTTEKLSFTATVKGVTGVKPTGTVTVHDGRGDTCTGNLNSAGVAKCSFTEKKGLRSITAHYNGDSNYAPAQTNTKVVVKG